MKLRVKLGAAFALEGVTCFIEGIRGVLEEETTYYFVIAVDSLLVRLVDCVP